MPDDSALIRVLRHGAKTDIVSSKSLLQQAYETTFGIHDHLKQALQEQEIYDADQKRPLSTVALHFAEDTMESSKIHELIRIYAKLKVHQYFGLSLIEFLTLPHEYVETILTECSEMFKKESEKTEKVMSQLNAAAND